MALRFELGDARRGSRLAPRASRKGVLAPDGVTLKLAEQHEGQVERPARRRRQNHAGLPRRAAALAMVAVVAGGDDVVPLGHAALGARQHMIDRQARAARLGATVLARLAVAIRTPRPVHGRRSRRGIVT